MYNLVDVIS